MTLEQFLKYGGEGGGGLTSDLKWGGMSFSDAQCCKNVGEGGIIIFNNNNNNNVPPTKPS